MLKLFRKFKKNNSAGFTQIVDFGFVFENVYKNFRGLTSKFMARSGLKFQKPKRFSKPKFTTGFTLVELLVTLSIFAITTGIVMVSQGKFDNSVLLTNTAYDIAITLRQAQTYGVNIKEGGTSGKFNPYGVVFFYKNGGDNKRFDLFEDLSYSDPTTYPMKYKLDNNFVCTASVSDLECVNSYKLKRGHYIKSITTYYDSGTSVTPDRVDISFVRPNPEAIILRGSDSYALANLAKSVEITISSADGSATRTIVVTKVGQIYVKR